MPLVEDSVSTGGSSWPHDDPLGFPEAALGQGAPEPDHPIYHRRHELTMSSDLTASIQSLVASLPPGSEVVAVEFARVVFRPGGEGIRSDLLTRPVTGTEPVVSCTDSVNLDPDPARMTALQRLQTRVAKHGDETIKVKEWAALLFAGDRPSGRELLRAVKADLLPHSIKAIGKDAGAQLVGSHDLLQYLTERERVLALDDPPEVWRQVVGARWLSAA